LIHLLSLNPALDFFFELEKPKSGRVGLAGKVGTLSGASVEAGGKALNAARFLKKMRVPAATWLGTGGGSDPTHLLFKALVQVEGLKVRFLSEKEPIRFTAVLTTAKQSHKYNHPGFELDLSGFGKFLQTVKRGDVLVLTGRLPGGMNDALYASWIKAFKKRGVKVVLDTSGPALSKALAQIPWFFKVNLFEFSEALKIRVPNLKKFSKLLPRLIHAGLLHGAVTHGAEGAVVWNGPEAYWVKSSAKSKGLVVGAGDGFLAGYLKGLQARKSFKESARLASAAALTVAQKGIMGFDAKELAKNLKTVKAVKL
jgi:fructose-1-phosphate kinase PfkB-like protein